MNIPSEKIEDLIERYKPRDPENSVPNIELVYERTYRQLIKELDSLIKWQPKTLLEYPINVQEQSIIMYERNLKILKAKHEMGYRDGDYSILYSNKNKWEVLPIRTANPELTFETREQGEEVIRIVGLNE